MRMLVLALAIVSLGATPALAQPAPPAAAATPHAKYTLETPIHTLMEDPVR
jgi:hypothetical protein